MIKFKKQFHTNLLLVQSYNFVFKSQFYPKNLQLGQNINQIKLQKHEFKKTILNL